MSNDFTYIQDEQISTIVVKLLNPNGSTYDMPSNFDFSLVLRLEKV